MGEVLDIPTTLTRAYWPQQHGWCKKQPCCWRTIWVFINSSIINIGEEGVTFSVYKIFKPLLTPFSPIPGVHKYATHPTFPIKSVNLLVITYSVPCWPPYNPNRIYWVITHLFTPLTTDQQPVYRVPPRTGLPCYDVITVCHKVMTTIPMLS